MKYLYGDLTEARYQEDSLGLLRRVVQMSVEVLKLHQEVDHALLEMQEQRNRMVQASEDLDGFHASLDKIIQSRLKGMEAGTPLHVMGQAVAEEVRRHAHEGKALVSADVDRRVNQLQAAADQLANTAFGAMKDFFMASGLPIQSSALTCDLEGLGYRALSEILDATGIVCTFELNTGSSEFFSGPKRFGDLVPGKQEVPIGTKKKRLKKEPVLELVRIDDAMITHISDSPEISEYRLQIRTGEAIDGVLVRINNQIGGVKLFKVAPGGDVQSVSNELCSQVHVDLLSRAWKKMRPHVQALYGARETLSAVRVEGSDVLEGRLFSEVVRRLVGYLTPIVREIDDHSPMQDELSLNIEHTEDGRREVFFLKKKELVERIHLLPEPQRRLFAPLGLEGRSKADTMTGVREVPEKTVEVAMDVRQLMETPPGPAPSRDKDEA